MCGVQTVAGIQRGFHSFEAGPSSAGVFDPRDDGQAAEAAVLLARGVSELREGAAACVKSLAECMESRRGVYLAQLKKSRDISNMATRTAVQVLLLPFAHIAATLTQVAPQQNERAEGARALQRLQEAMDLRHNQALKQAHERVHAAENRCQQHDATVAQLQARVDELAELDRSRTQLQQQAVAAALECQKDRIALEADHRQALLQADRERIQADAQAQIDSARLHNQALLAVQQQHDAQIHSMLTADRARLDRECSLLREQLGHATAQVRDTLSLLCSCSERARCADCGREGPFHGSGDRGARQARAAAAGESRRAVARGGSPARPDGRHRPQGQGAARLPRLFADAHV